MRLTPNQIVAAVAQPGDSPKSILHGIYQRRWNGILEGKIEKGAAIELDLDNACLFAVLLELSRVGIYQGSVFNRVAILALKNWSDARPPIAPYASPIAWAVHHIRAGGEIALGMYSARDGDAGIGVMAAVFDTESPIIPDSPVVRIALNLSDLLLPVLAKLDAMQSAKQRAH